MQSDAMCCWVEVHEQDPVSRGDAGAMEMHCMVFSDTVDRFDTTLNLIRKCFPKKTLWSKTQSTANPLLCFIACVVSWMVPARPPCGGHLETMIYWGMKFTDVGMVLADVGLIYADIGMAHHPTSKQQTNPIYHIRTIFQKCLKAASGLHVVSASASCVLRSQHCCLSHAFRRTSMCSVV